jgi:hypothetical protein
LSDHCPFNGAIDLVFIPAAIDPVSHSSRAVGVNPRRAAMTDSIMYHDGNRRLQDQFDSRRISDRLEEKLTRTQFTPDDRTLIESLPYFFLATTDAGGAAGLLLQGWHAGLRARHRAI